MEKIYFIRITKISDDVKKRYRHKTSYVYYGPKIGYYCGLRYPEPEECTGFGAFPILEWSKYPSKPYFDKKTVLDIIKKHGHFGVQYEVVEFIENKKV